MEAFEPGPAWFDRMESFRMMMKYCGSKLITEVAMTLLDNEGGRKGAKHTKEANMQGQHKTETNKGRSARATPTKSVAERLELATRSRSLQAGLDCTSSNPFH